MQQQQVGPDGTIITTALPPPTQQIKSSDGRTTEELIADRTVAAAIAQVDPRYQPTIISGGTGTTNKNTFDLDAERERRRQLDLLWYRSKEEEHEEEEELRAELRLVEAQIRKLKKSGGHIQAAQGQAGGSRAATPLPSAEGAMDRATLDEAFASAAPVPKSGTPYMQSGLSRGSAGINKSLLKRMEIVLKELHVPDEPLPTKRVCDMYDSVRKDTITLIALEKICLKREQEVQGRRTRLSKLGGSLAALKAAERAKAKSKARQAASKAKSKKASSSSGSGKTASGTSTTGGEKKKSTSGGSKSKSKKTKADKATSGDGTAPAASGAAAGAATESPKKKPAKKSKKKKAPDGDDAAKPKAKKPKKAASGTAGGTS